MQRNLNSRASRRENDRVVFERLWRGTFQAVLAGPQNRPRAASHDHLANMAVAPSDVVQQGPSTADLEPALRTILAGLRAPCCCRCNCASTERLNDNLQVCLSNEERKSMRSVIRCVFWNKALSKVGFTPYLLSDRCFDCVPILNRVFWLFPLF